MRLIDADALVKFIDYGHLNNPNDKLYSENDIREMIDMMPTVEPKHGHWVMSNGDYEWECSSCGCGYTDYRTTYCYDCGAKMDEVEDETD